jgi:hypothetical protein
MFSNFFVRASRSKDGQTAECCMDAATITKNDQKVRHRQVKWIEDPARFGPQHRLGVIAKGVKNMCVHCVDRHLVVLRV